MPHSRPRLWLIALAIVVALGILFAPWIRAYGNSLVLLLRLEHSNSFLARAQASKVGTKDTTIQLPQGAINARLYRPAGIKDPPALLLVHGVHHLGMNDPRLVLLATSFAERGLLVLTPEVRQLEDYRVEPGDIDTIGEAAMYLKQQTGRAPAVLGISFSGSLALLAAADSRYADAIATVVAVGAYDDLQHVARFLFTGEALLPDGTLRPQPAEQYGALVFVYDHPEHYFSAADQVPAQAALKLWLEEQWQAAHAAENSVSAAGRESLEDLFRYRMRPLAPKIEAALAQDAAEMQRISPHGQLQSLRTPIFLLHGTDDEVIPSSETEWLARDVPHTALCRSLMTPAFSHVDAKAHVTVKNQLELVSFMAAVFHQIETGQVRSRASSQ
jgi:pimeloyl-ACP methyl ester carboxylesterase